MLGAPDEPGAIVRIAVESAEIATLKEDGRPWDGVAGARVPPTELAAFFALDLTRQLDRLVEEGAPPVPPDAFVRVYAGAAGEGPATLLLETGDEKSFEPRWAPGPGTEIDAAAGAPLRIEVWDRDLVFHDAVGATEVTVPEHVPPEGRWVLGPFGQVRRLVLRVRRG